MLNSVHVEGDTRTEDWRVVLVQGRNDLLRCIIGMNWAWKDRDLKLKEINSQIAKIDELLALHPKKGNQA